MAQPACLARLEGGWQLRAARRAGPKHELRQETDARSPSTGVAQPCRFRDKGDAVPLTPAGEIGGEGGLKIRAAAVPAVASLPVMAPCQRIGLIVPFGEISQCSRQVSPHIDKP
jgi:hypothetical protein